MRSMAASFLLAGGISWGFGFPGDTFLPTLLFDWSNEWPAVHLCMEAPGMQ